MNRYKPMLAKNASGPFDSKDWIFEVKWDGIRAISYINDELSIKSRNNRELKHNFPELEELKGLAADTVLDGEIVVMRNGRPDFQTLLERSRTTSIKTARYMARIFPATYILFDILEKDGDPLTDFPLTKRKDLLKGRLKEGEHVILSLFVEEHGKAYHKATLDRGLEGIIAKKKDSPYEQGVRSGSWLKIKKLKSCDCAVFGYTKGEGSRRESFGALILGLYDAGNPIYVGKVGTGFSQSEMALLMKTFKELETEEETLHDIDVRQSLVWLRPEVVCEVIYQSVTRDGRLRMPRFRGLRVDKAPSECTVDQIREKILHEYVSKRNFAVTTEPHGTGGIRLGRIFIVQEHHARRLHYDFRLEKEEVLKSWAVPKGMPMKSGEKRLAVETEDHPLEYSKFEGTIPLGQYGAGEVKIWDRGSYDLIVWQEDKIEFVLRGEKLHGRYALVKLKKAKEKEWLILKAGDSDG